MAARPMVPTIFAPRRRGRRPVSMIPIERAKHVEAARLMDFEGIDVPTIAVFLRCKPRTVYHWASMAREYPEYAKLCRERAS